MAFTCFSKKRVGVRGGVRVRCIYFHVSAIIKVVCRVAFGATQCSVSVKVLASIGTNTWMCMHAITGGRVKGRKHFWESQFTQQALRKHFSCHDSITTLR